MFTHAMLMASLDKFPYSCEVSNMRLEKFDLDFESLNPDDCEIIARSKPTYSGLIDGYTRPQDFWLRAMWERRFKPDAESFKEYASSAMFRYITEVELNDFIEKTWFHLIRAGLISVPLHEPKGFRGSMLMYDDWNDQGIFAEYEDGYIAVFSTRTS